MTLNLKSWGKAVISRQRPIHFELNSCEAVLSLQLSHFLAQYLLIKQEHPTFVATATLVEVHNINTDVTLHSAKDRVPSRYDALTD